MRLSCLACRIAKERRVLFCLTRVHRMSGDDVEWCQATKAAVAVLRVSRFM
jgi:hypothetical protein